MRRSFILFTVFSTLSTSALSVGISNNSWDVKFDSKEAVAYSRIKQTKRRTLYMASSDPVCTTKDDIWQASPTALVGSFFSYFQSIERYCGAHPYVSRRLSTINISTGKTSSILEVFGHRDILSVLIKDPFIAKSLGGQSNFSSLNNFMEFYNSHNKECLLLSEDTFQNFTFYDYDTNSGKAAVRIGLSPKFSDCAPGFIQIGLWLDVPQSMRSLFREARSKNNLMKYMRNYTSYPLK